MTPTEAHGRLDTLGVLDDAHGEGTYALAVDVPNGVESVQRAYMDAKGHPLDDGMADQLASAETCVYVGRSGNVYDRIMDHVDGQVRRASFLTAFGIDDIHGVYLDDENSDLAERNRARTLSSATTLTYTDGELF